MNYHRDITSFQKMFLYSCFLIGIIFFFLSCGEPSKGESTLALYCSNDITKICKPICDGRFAVMQDNIILYFETLEQCEKR